MFFQKKKAGGPVDFIIAGLGNPGMQYENTRHNSGFMAIEALEKKLGVRVDRVQFHALCGRAEIGGKQVLLMKPQTYMNNSGEAVCAAMKFYKVPPENTLILFDDISLPVGTVRVRRKGSDGGQRGMRSISMIGGSDNFPRVKIGIGAKPHPDYDLAKWVLSRFSATEKPLWLEAGEKAADAACLIVAGDIDKAMNQYSK